MLKIISNVDLYNEIDKYDAILIGTNIYGYMSHGFQRKIMLNYHYVHEKNIGTKYGDESKMGTILECKNYDNPTFVLCYIYKDPFNRRNNKDYLSYESLEKCLKIINILYKGKNVASTILGFSKFEGNGDKDKILKIIKDSTKDINLTLYDYEQLSRHDELKKIREAEIKLKEVDADAYYEAVKKRKADAEERFKNNGHARY
jgi:hypothetical protein